MKWLIQNMKLVNIQNMKLVHPCAQRPSPEITFTSVHNIFFSGLNKFSVID